jgi:hypothetical protein
VKKLLSLQGPQDYSLLMRTRQGVGVAESPVQPGARSERALVGWLPIQRLSVPALIGRYLQSHAPWLSAFSLSMILYSFIIVLYTYDSLVKTEQIKMIAPAFAYLRPCYAAIAARYYIPASKTA